MDELAARGEGGLAREAARTPEQAAFPAAADPTPGGLDLHYGHRRMPLSERAKIFAPFNPLRGFTEALRAQEELHEQAQLAATEPPEDPA